MKAIFTWMMACLFTSCISIGAPDSAIKIVNQLGERCVFDLYQSNTRDGIIRGIPINSGAFARFVPRYPIDLEVYCSSSGYEEAYFFEKKDVIDAKIIVVRK